MLYTPPKTVILMGNVMIVDWILGGALSYLQSPIFSKSLLPLFKRCCSGAMKAGVPIFSQHVWPFGRNRAKPKSESFLGESHGMRTIPRSLKWSFFGKKHGEQVDTITESMNIKHRIPGSNNICDIRFYQKDEKRVEAVETADWFDMFDMFFFLKVCREVVNIQVARCWRTA